MPLKQSRKMELNEKLIEQLRNGEISVKNDGNLYQLREVIKAAFPDCEDVPIGSDIFYFHYEDIFWSSDTEWNLPPVSVKDFYINN